MGSSLRLPDLKHILNGGIRMFVNCRNLAGALALIAASVVQVQAEDVKLKLAGILPAEHFGTAIVGEMVKEIESAGTGITIRQRRYGACKHICPSGSTT